MDSERVSSAQDHPHPNQLKPSDIHKDYVRPTKVDRLRCIFQQQQIPNILPTTFCELLASFLCSAFHLWIDLLRDIYSCDSVGQRKESLNSVTSSYATFINIFISNNTQDSLFFLYFAFKICFLLIPTVESVLFNQIFTLNDFPRLSRSDNFFNKAKNFLGSLKSRIYIGLFVSQSLEIYHSRPRNLCPCGKSSILQLKESWDLLLTYSGSTLSSVLQARRNKEDTMMGRCRRTFVRSQFGLQSTL